MANKDVKMKTMSELDVYDRSETSAGFYDIKRKIIVESEWNERDKVILVINGERLKVSGRELIIAVESAQRAYKF